ncbi:MAG: hypothetical protein D6768_01835, partial [Chloroflexi bacterium]
MIKKHLIFAVCAFLLSALALAGVRVDASGSPGLTATATPTRATTPLTGTLTLTTTSTISQTATPRWKVFTNANCTRDMVIVGDTLWAATCGGVVRWDIPSGAYQKYTTADGLFNNIIEHIAADERGQVWVSYGKLGANGNLQAIGHFDGSRWANITGQGLNQPLRQVNDLAVDRAGQVWLAYQLTTTPLAMFNGQNWTNFGKPDGLPPLPARALLAGSDGRVWAVFGSTVAVFDGTTWQTYDSTETGLSVTTNAMSQDGQGRIWFSSADGLTRFDGQHWVQFPAAAANGPSILAADDQGGVWVATEPGLLRHFDGQTWHNYTTKDGMPATAITNLATDETGRLWLTTYEGLAIVFDGQDAAKLVTDDLLPGNAVSALDISPNGEIWVVAGRQVTQLSPTAEGEYRATIHTQPGKLRRGTTFDHDSQGRIWMINKSGAVSVFNGHTWRDYPKINGTDYKSGRPLVDSAGRVWVTLGNALAMLDGDRWQVFDPPPEWPAGWAGDLVEGPAGDIWRINRSRGLGHFDGQKWNLRPYAEISPALKEVDTIAFDGQGRLWLAKGYRSYDNSPWGVWVDDGTSVTHYGQRDGLAQERITTLTGDADGHIWVGYDSTFTQSRQPYAAGYFDGETWYTYILPHGLAGPQVNHIAVDN